MHLKQNPLFLLSLPQTPRFLLVKRFLIKTESLF